MRKLVMSLLITGGVALAGAMPASATGAAGAAAAQLSKPESQVSDVHWRGHRGGIYFGFGGFPYYGGYGYYPRYRSYDDDYYYRPRYYSYYGGRHYRGYRHHGHHRRLRW